MILRRQGWGEDRVDYLDLGGRVRMIPASWTSLVAADPFEVISAGRSWFRVEDLLTLSRLIDALGEKESGR
jgi:hypothetical protein